MAEQEPELRLFGAPHWSAGGGARHDLPDNLPGYLVAYLAYRADWVGRDALAGLFWPDRADDEAQHNLRANLHRARTLLGGWARDAALQSERRRVRIDLPSDVGAFRAALGRGDWAAAHALHGQTLLSALSFRGFALLDEWARTERLALADAWRDATLKAAAALENAGDAGAAAAMLLRLAQTEWATEDGVQALLRTARAAGRRSDALAAYERFARWLADELGLQPMGATAALADALRSERAAPAPSAAPAPWPAPATAGVPRSIVQPPAVIGRDRELRVVADLSIPIVAVAGEPGVGKTRLIEQALPGARWLACREGFEQVPFAPVIDWLHDFRDSLPDLGDYRRDVARLLPELAPGELLQPADPALGKTRLLEGLARALEHGARALVIDDVQWADTATLELVRFVARRRALALRLAYRNVDAAPAVDALLASLDADGGVESIALAPLSADALQALLANLAGTGAGPARFGAWLHARTGGNPVFALQTLRALFESGRLRAAATGWASDLDAVTIDYSELEIPARVAELVRRRLRGLSDSARRVLGVVALCGSAGFVDRIGVAAGLSPWATAEAIAEAEAAGLLRDGRFVHDVVRETHVAAMPAPLQAVMHAAVARHFGDVLPAAQVAEHWWAAGQPAPALDAALRAVDGERHAGLHAQALALLDRAAARVDPAGAERARIDAARARVCLETGDLDAAAAHARHALDGPALPADRAAALRVVAAIAMQRGRLDDAARALSEAAASAPEDVELLIDRAALAQLQARVADVIAPLERERDRLRRERPGLPLVRVLTSLGAGYDEAGDPARGLPLHQEAYRLATRLGARYAQVNVAVNLLWSLSGLDRNDEAIAVAREALALGDYDGTPTLRNNLAWVLAERGDLDEARALYEVLAAGADPTLALIAHARLVDLCARGGDTAGLQAALTRTVAALTTTEVPVARAAAAIGLLRHGSDAHVERAVAALVPAPLDPWMRERLQNALQARGIDPAPYIVADPRPG
jgi:DNA-binding SARP family transcriptional activator/tetratricopeptide (TPR) repeat protein